MKPVLQENQYGPFRYWEPPLMNRKYVVGVDTAEGKERDIGFARRHHLSRDDEPDYSAAVVIELETGLHVATFKDKIPATDWAYVAAAIGYLYNEAFIVPEVNSVGAEVVNILVQRVRYPDVYINRVFNKVTGDDFGTEWGWRQSETTRPRLIARIEEVLNDYRLFTRDHELIKELRTMEYDDNGRARAKRPHHDDLVIALGLALQGRYERLQNTGERDRLGHGLDHLSEHDRAFWMQRRKELADALVGGRHTDRPGLIGSGPRGPEPLPDTGTVPE